MINSYEDRINGNVTQRQGVSGQGLKFDQYSTEIVREKAEEAPDINPDSFTIEAWVAPQSYPWNWCPVIMQRDEKQGYYFGVDGDGRFGLHVAVEGEWYECNSKMPFAGLRTEHQWNSDRRAWEYKGEGDVPGPKPFGESRGEPVVPLLKWSHIVGTFDSEKGIRIYRNGMLEGSLRVYGKMTPALEAEMRIGRDTRKMRPTHTERPRFTFPINYSFDGLVDELKIYNKALSAQEVMQAFLQTQPATAQPLEFRKIPTGPKGPKPFGAYYKKLDYDEDYDRQWRIAEHQDVIVMFDEYPFKLVYWHGINGYPVWYSENDIGLMNEDTETWGHLGCQEALMDRQCRYSRVRIIESNDARVVVHWRHALNNIEYELIHEDPLTGRGDWADEYFTIYPDGVAVRHWVYWTSTFGEMYLQFQETILKSQPGQSPEDILEVEALTLANMQGQTHTYSWEDGCRMGLIFSL
ncbi:MAG: LamG domain-containing protein [Planctomycetota bacterium]